jgi:DNA-binding NtrC family response regulator
VKTAAAAVVPTKQLRLGKDVLLETLEATRWNMTRTAELLQWSRSTLYRNLARYKIQRHSEQETRSASAAPEEESDLPRRRAAAV